MEWVPIILAALLLAVPLILALIVFRTRVDTWFDWLVLAVGSLGLGGYAILVGRWDLLSYFLRPVLALLLLAALVVSFLRTRRAPWWRRPERRREWFGLGVNVLVAAVFAGFAGHAVSGLSAGRAASVDLAFPLRDGVAYVGQGGANPLLNYHNTNRTQAYALDIVALNAAGLHAWGLAPAELEAYAIWGRDVSSPCSGTAVAAVDEFADQRPPRTDRENRAGNHVVIRCAGGEPSVDVLLAHLQRGSVAVEPGAPVEAGQFVGRVGNTGNTSEPHLHVHAVRTGSGSVLDGEAVPIRFDGKFLVRNDVIFGD